jgi:hypothetical protein
LFSGASPALSNLIVKGNTAGYYGGGICNRNNSSPTLTDVQITGNTANTYGGGGIYNYNSSPTLTDVKITDNKADDYGGGIYNSSSSPVLTNVQISGNTADNYGGGIFNNVSSPVLTNVQITGNTAVHSGGGIYNNNSSSPTLTNVQITENTAKAHGGGIYNSDSSPTLTDVQITNNTAPEGGGIHNYNSSPVLTNMQISDNTASIYYGGGIYNNSSSPTLTNVQITGNTANSYNGGGIYNNSSSPTLTNVKITGNKANNSGGGIYNNNSSSPVLTNVQITDNKAGASGGGIYNYNSSSVLTNVQITGNTAGDYGGGIDNNGSSSPVLTNVTVAGNYAANNSGGIYFSSTSTLQVRNSIIYGNTAGSSNPNVSNFNAAIYANSLVEGATLNAGIISNADPQFVASYYATDITPKTGGDYHLLSTSPAVDKGNNAFYNPGQTLDLSAVTTDLAGNTRIQNCNVDLGSYEYDCPGLPAVKPDDDSIVYVTVDGAGLKDGSSWENAYEGLAKPLAAARLMSCIKQIWVAAGTYNPTRTADDPLNVSQNATDRDNAFLLVEGVKIYGGFNGTLPQVPTPPKFGEANRDGVSILSGDVNTTNTNDAYHVVLGVGTLTSATVLDGFTVTGANSLSYSYSSVTVNGVTDVYRYNGGGIALWSGASPALSNLIVTGNTASFYGGGIYNNSSSSPKLTNVQISGNTASTNSGGGIYNSNSSPELISNVKISSNKANNSGGGIYNSGSSSPTLTDVQITSNTAGASGGGIYNNSSSSSPVLTNVQINGNTANNYGGGIYNYSSSPKLTNVQIIGNTATNNNGGGIYNYSSSPKLTNVQISGNTASTNYGGGIYNTESSPTLTNVQITGNTATYGGGIYNSSNCLPVLTNVTVAGNYASTNWGGIYFYNTSTQQAFNSIIYGNHIGSTTGTPAVNVSSDNAAIYANSLVEGMNAGIASADPQFVAPDYAIDLSPTTGGDYRLQYTSPAINQGNNAFYNSGQTPDLSAVTTDLAGNARIQGCAIELGSYEFVTPPVKPDAKGIVYVKESASGTGDGSSWDDAYGGLADPLAAARVMSCIKEIWVAEGTYKPTRRIDDPLNVSQNDTDRDNAFRLVEGVKIYGGFNASNPENSVDNRTIDITAAGIQQMKYKSVLSGDINSDDAFAGNAYHVVAGVGTLTTANTVLDGFTITKAYSNELMYSLTIDGLSTYRHNGGGIYLNHSASPALSNLIVTSNAVYGNGSGIYIGGSSLTTLTNVQIIENTTSSSGYGGGIYIISSSSSTLTKVQITGNSSANGGGMYIYSDASRLTNVQITGNTASSNGGGIYDYYGSSMLTNVQITGNTAGGDGGGIYNSDGIQKLTNVTIAGNYAAGNCGGIYFYSNQWQQVRNSIIYGNTAAGNNPNVNRTTGGIIYANSLVEGMDAGIADADPQFTLLDKASSGSPTTGGDYHLQPASPAIERGNNAFYKSGQTPDLSAVTTDLADNDRIQGCTVDLGAYETSVNVIVPDGGGRVYVRQGGAGDGSSWENAFPDFALPLYLAQQCDIINEIWVADGVYRPGFTPPITNYIYNRDKTFYLAKDVKIYGGFTDTVNKTPPAVPPAFGSVDRNGVSILSGDIGIPNDNIDNVYHVVMAEGDMGEALLDGFTVAGGYCEDIAIHSKDSYLTTDDNRTFYRYHGAGINVFGKMKFVNLRITGNSAFQAGGGMYLNGSSSDSVIITNTAVFGNYANCGGGIYVNDGTCYMTNLTVTGNTISDRGAGLYCYSSGTAYLRNSIVWGNRKTDGTVSNVYATVNHSHNLVEGNYVNNSGIISNADPMFVDASAGDYHLKAGSLAIDIGDNTFYDDDKQPDLNGIITDLAGNVRIQSCNVDLGAYETSNGIMPANGGRVYVRRGGTGNGSSWDDAYPNLAVPLYLAQQCGITEIWVAHGVYLPEFTPAVTGTTTLTNRDKTFYLAKDVKIYGGFTDTVNKTPPAVPPAFGSADRNGVSILSGDIGTPNDNTDNVYHVVMTEGDMGKALLDGFTVAGGYSKDITIGSYVTTDSNRTFDRNRGAGITVYGKMKFVNLKVTGNSAYQHGGGMYLNGSNSDSVIITNTAVSGNEAQDGGGILLSGGTCYMTNLTITDNTGNVGGFYLYYSGTAYLRNSIVWGNRKTDGTASNVGGDINHSHNLVEGDNVNGFGIISNADPRFVDASGGDYHLKAGSPAINSGNNAFYDVGKQPDLNSITTDLDGNPRIYWQNIDLGVFEVQKAPVIAVNDTARTTVNMPVTIKVLANDDLGSCSDTPSNVFKIVRVPIYGTVAFDVATLIYTPASGHFGIDSLDYRFECNGNFASARVYILTLKPLSKEYRACPDAQITMGFEACADVSYDWLAADMYTVIKSSSDTIKRVKDNTGNPQTFYARPSWKGIEFPLDKVVLFQSADVTPTASDIRVTLCPSLDRKVYLTGYLDSLSYASTTLWTTTGVFPTIYNASTGEIHASDFPERGTFAYYYTRYSECATSSATGKAYVYITRGKIPHRSDTVLICLDQAAAINISAIFGLELGGNWNYLLDPDDIVSNNTVITPSGTVIFNGEKVFPTTNAAYKVTYRGVASKGFVFEYDYSKSNCAIGSKRITIVIR